jgi:hypothetical protein
VSSYRDLANRSVVYQAQIRDRDVENQGIRTTIQRPTTENNVDFYGDPINTYGNKEPISVIPLYAQYYQLVDVLGQDIELTLALDCIVKVNEYIPNESVIHLEVRNNKGSLEKRWWRVLSTEIKHVERHYARVAHLAPVREPINEYTRTIDVKSITEVDSDVT